MEFSVPEHILSLAWQTICKCGRLENLDSEKM